MNPLKKHYETLTILGGMAVLLVSSCMWLNGKFSHIDEKFTEVNTRLTKIETILIMRGIMPIEMASTSKKEE